MGGVIGRLVDVEGAIKTWALFLPEVVALAPGGVFLEMPSQPVYPLLRVVGVVAGTPDPGETPLYSPLVQFDAWGGTRKEAADLAYAVAQAAEQLRAPTPADDVVLLSGVVMRLPQFDPDPPSGRARYSVDVQFTVRSV